MYVEFPSTIYLICLRWLRILNNTSSAHLLSHFLSGDLASISTECPYGIKLLVCQLLLEITSFLRDNYLLSLTYRERTLTSASRSHVDNRKKSTVSLCKPGRVGGRHPMPVIAVHDEANMTVVPKRKMSGYQGAYAVHVCGKMGRWNMTWFKSRFPGPAFIISIQHQVATDLVKASSERILFPVAFFFHNVFFKAILLKTTGFCCWNMGWWNVTWSKLRLLGLPFIINIPLKY